MAMKNIDSVCLDLLLFLFCFTDIYCWRLYLPVCIPIRSCSFSFGKCLMTKSLTDVLSSNDNLAICDAWSAISVGSPLTTDHSGQSTDYWPQWAVHWPQTAVGSPLTTRGGQSTDHRPQSAVHWPPCTRRQSSPLCRRRSGRLKRRTCCTVPTTTVFYCTFQTCNEKWQWFMSMV